MGVSRGCTAGHGGDLQHRWLYKTNTHSFVGFDDKYQMKNGCYVPLLVFVYFMAFLLFCLANDVVYWRDLK